MTLIFNADRETDRRAVRYDAYSLPHIKTHRPIVDNSTGMVFGRRGTETTSRQYIGDATDAPSTRHFERTDQ